MVFEAKRVGGRRRTGRVLVGVGILLLILVVSIGAAALVDWLWFSAVGYASVFTTILSTRVLLFLGAALLFFALFVVNLQFARRFAQRRQDLWRFIASLEARQSDRVFSLVALTVGAAGALILGSYASGQWAAVLRLTAAQPFGIADPLFGRDVAFFVFQMPVLEFVQGWLFAAAGIIFLAVLLVYAYKLIWPQLPAAPTRADISMPEFRLDLSLDRAVKVHLGVLAAILLIILAAGFWLDIFDLVRSRRGVAFGASYTDVMVYQNVLKVLIALSLIGAVAVLSNSFTGGIQLTTVAFGLILAVWLVGGAILPALIQRFEVQPNELVKERPYIENNIRMTRLAYALDRVREETVPVQEAVTRAEIQDSPATIKNIRLWDPQPLLDTYNQIQSIRQYYDFVDADVDRYVINGEYRQVMLSARELSPEKLQQTAQTWVNRVLQYTHGFGVVLSPVNEVTTEGLPILFVRDVPPQGVIPIDRPEIYYGEKTQGYVIVDTREAEFDYPMGDENVYTRYQGEGGIPLSSYLHRLVFAWEFKDVNILLSNALTPESQILFRREIRDRIQTVAPFLSLDSDPYIVIDGGRLYWIQDAYTSTDRFPYAQPTYDGSNYVRNSVKVVTDAYSGDMTFYLADPDPIISAYAQVFPGLFRPLSDMPETLRAHLRYPEDLFSIQAEIYRTYHMQDPRVFYNKEDLWNIPNEIYLEPPPRPMMPYYVIMRLPGESSEEFVLIRPYTPSNKDNMITWLAARSDGDNYGSLFAYKYPKESLVYGPMQIESRINQDTVISSQLTLWNQQGSRVLRGNLLVIPVGLGNLYVEPIYLQSEQSRLPELKRVVLSSGGALVMEPTVNEALASLFGGAAIPNGATGTAPSAEPGSAAATDQAQRLAQSLRGRSAQLRQDLDALERELNQLLSTLGESPNGAAATPGPAASPVPATTPVPAGAGG